MRYLAVLFQEVNEDGEVEEGIATIDEALRYALVRSPALVKSIVVPEEVDPHSGEFYRLVLGGFRDQIPRPQSLVETTVEPAEDKES